MTQVNINNMDGKLQDLNQSVAESIKKTLEKQSVALNTGNVLNGGETKVTGEKCLLLILG